LRDINSTAVTRLPGVISPATVEGLLLLKLYALPSLYRQGNVARVGIYENDIAALLYYYPVDIAQLLQELGGYVSESDLGEIGVILENLQKRPAGLWMRRKHKPVDCPFRVAWASATARSLGRELGLKARVTAFLPALGGGAGGTNRQQLFSPPPA
jgi:hypothetical protein